jgi:hypothetical protein
MSLIKAQGTGDASTGLYSHTIDQSLRFEGGDSAVLSRTPSSTGNRRTWTWSGWVKRSVLGTSQNFYTLFSAGPYTGSSTHFAFYYSGSKIDIISFYQYTGGYQIFYETDQLFRDSSAWYNFVVEVDTTDSTSTDRVKIHVNGTRITSFQTSTAPSLNLNTYLNLSSETNYVGSSSRASTDNLNGYLSEVNFIDGTALDPTSFGETKAGIWVPKDTSGLTFGTNGYRLKFQDSSALGDDTSGNGNDFSSSGLAATDVVLDSPTNNWATMNPLDGNGPTISEGSLKVFGDTSYSVFEGFKGTFPMSSGKWYWEVYIDVGGFTQTGITPTTNTAVISTTNLSYHTDAMTYESNGKKAIGTGGTGTAPSGRTISSYGNSYTDGDIIGVALDLDSSTTTLTFYKNNSSEGTAFSSLASAEYVPVHAGIQNNFGIFNFGQDSSFAGNKTSGSAGASDANGNGDFYYSPPSGYLACCTANLPDPGIDPAQNEEPADYFNTKLFNGNAGTQSITGVGFQPQWLWIKRRDSSPTEHGLFDIVRGAGKSLKSNSNVAEQTQSDSVTSFDSDGFSLGDNTEAGPDVNYTSGASYVAWNWLAGGSASSNSNGSITSSVSASTKAGFSIVSYTGNATAGATVGHGLSSTPEMYIVKSRSLATSWVTYHKDAAASPEDGYLILNGTDAFYDTLVWNDTAPTSSVFSLGGTGYSSNNSGATYITYCFHSVDGYSRVGKFTGNGSTDGSFVHTGFKPAWLMIKSYDQTRNWTLFDNKRTPFNEMDGHLHANATVAEQTGSDEIDFLSNGFKFRSGDADSNYSNFNYIYLCFAEQPFKYANAR